MRSAKKLLALALTLVFALSFVLPAMAKEIKDFADGQAALDYIKADKKGLEDDYAKAVQFMIDLEIMTGTDDNKLNLDQPLSRLEFIVLLYKALNGGKSVEASGMHYVNAPSFFKDIVWGKGYANWAGMTGVSAGTGDNNFSPNDPIAFKDALLLCMKAIEFRTDLEPGFDGSAAAIYAVADPYGLMSKLFAMAETNSGGHNLVDRAGACMMINNILGFGTFDYYNGVRQAGPLREDRNTGASTVLLVSKFGFIDGRFQIVSDGAWFALPGTDLNKDGKAVIVNTGVWNNPLITNPNGSISSRTRRLSVDITKQLGIDIKDVGREINIMFRNPSWGDVTQVYTSDNKGLVYADKMQVLDIRDAFNPVNEIYDTSVQKELAGATGTRYNNYEKDNFFVNYSNGVNLLSEMRNFGQTGLDATSKLRFATSAGNGFVNGGANYTGTWASVTSIDVAQPKAGAFPGFDAPKEHAGYYNTWDNAEIRVIFNDYDEYDKKIAYVFIEHYTFTRFNEVGGNGRIALFTGANNDSGLKVAAPTRVGNGSEPKNVLGWDAVKDSVKKGDVVATCRIGWGTGLVGIKPLTKIEGKPTYINNDLATITIGGSTYGQIFFAKGGHNNHNLDANYGTSAVDQDVTIWLFNNAVVQFTGPGAAPDTYCVVLDSAMEISGGAFGSGAISYKVQVLLADGTTHTYNLRDIRPITSPLTAAKEAHKFATNGSLPGPNRWNAVSTSNYSRLQFNSSISGSLFNGGRVIGDSRSGSYQANIFKYTLSGSDITLTEVYAYEGTTATGSSLSGVSTIFNSGYAASPSSVNSIHGKYVTPATTVLIPANNGFSVYDKQNIPSITRDKNGLYYQYISMDVDGGNVADATNRPAVKMAFLKPGTDDGIATSVSDDWVIAAQQPGLNAGGKWTINVIKPDGSTMLLTTSDGTNRFLNAAHTDNGGRMKRGDWFKFSGPADAVTGVTLDAGKTDDGTLTKHEPAIGALTIGVTRMQYKSDAKFLLFYEYNYGQPERQERVINATDIDTDGLSFAGYYPNGDKIADWPLIIQYIVNSDGLITGGTIMVKTGP